MQKIHSLSNRLDTAQPSPRTGGAPVTLTDHWAKPFSCVPMAAAKDERLTKTALRVMIVLAGHAHRTTGACTVTLDRLAQETGLARCKISAATALLVKAGWLSKSGQGGRSCAVVYRLQRLEPAAEAVPVTASVPAPETVNALPEPVTDSAPVTVTKPVTVTELVTVTEGVNLTPETLPASVSETLPASVKGIEQIIEPIISNQTEYNGRKS